MSDDLVRRIVNESHGVSVKVGRTNGRPAYHMIHSGLRQSQTIFTLGEWDSHPWNDYNRPKASKEDITA